MKKQMKSYPSVITDIETLDRVYNRLLRDTSVVFVQAKHTVDLMAHVCYQNHTDWSHLKGGAADASASKGDIFADIEDGYKPSYDAFNLFIWTLEWMRPDKVLHKIEVRLPDRPLFTDCLGLGQ